MKKHLYFSSLILLGCLLLSCDTSVQTNTLKNTQLKISDLTIHSSNAQLVEVFNWAKVKARSFVQTGKKGQINGWERGEGTGSEDYIPSYWAGYPKRQAFYSRDFCHQLIGAHLLGLEEENFSMLKAFAKSADEGKKWFPLWAINFDGSPFLLDYRGDEDFVREVPATFELVEKANELYQWTGDQRYIQDEVLWNYYNKVVTDFITLHDTQLPNGIAEGTGKGIFAGAASYNEQKDFPLIEAGDGIAAQYKALEAFTEMAAYRNQSDLAKAYKEKAAALKTYFNQEWDIGKSPQYIRGYIANGNAIDGWGKENSWFMLMKGIVEGGTKRTLAYLDFVNERLESKDDIPDNVEALSYLPETFFYHHQNERAWRWMKHIMDNLKEGHTYEEATGKNGDYPEVSYVLVRNMVKDLMGLSPDIPNNTLTTLSHLPKAVKELEIENIKIGDFIVSIKHNAEQSTQLNYKKGRDLLTWKAGFVGKYSHLYLNGAKTVCQQAMDNGHTYSYCELKLESGDQIVVSIN